MTTTGKNRIMIFGPKDDGTYIVEFRTAAGEALAISIPRTETAVIRLPGPSRNRVLLNSLSLSAVTNGR